ncbi:MAG: ribosomal L7Ae/L30e/S12e/Gadd45 family protein, partial [Selenomonadales bacterium]|nr:ribosomal L7Ae/L30e/S12e/Gadd45 family protein [Selenomonadales bacterium]
MSLERLKNGKKVIGIKQTTKAVTKNIATCVFLADDADERVLAPLKALCEANKV